MKACFASLMLLAPMLAAQSPPPLDAVSDRVGATVGEFRVTESGSASYQVPITVTPGTAGVEPKLALVYDSNSGDSTMGPGWSLSGASAITRCRPTRESGDFIVSGAPVDGDSQNITFHPRDRFCLDGQRLILVSTDKAYGDADAEYRLESDRFTRIYSRGGINAAYAIGQSFITYTGPNHFIVQRRDGTVSEYGNSADSRLEANGQPNNNMGFVWAVNRLEDSSGNYMTFEYEEDFAGGEQRLRFVRYTGKRQLPGQSAPASLPYATIALNYAPAALRREAYVSGARTSRTRLLQSIDAAGARFYRLDYAASPSLTGEQVLQALTECSDSSMSVCYPATTFEWSQASLSLTSTYGPVNNGSKLITSSRFGDVDGDGRLDAVSFYREPFGICAESRISIGYGERRADGGLWLNTTLSGPPLCVDFKNTTDGSVDQWWQLLDYNGDGRDDLLLAENPDPDGNPNNGIANPNARWRIHPSRGRGGFTQAGGFDTSIDLLATDNIVINAQDTRTQMQLADFNADGLPDMIYALITGSGNTQQANYFIRFLERVPADTRFRYSAPYSVDLFSNLPAGHPCLTGFCASGELELSQSARQLYRPQDLDGDGRADLYAQFRETLPERISPFVDYRSDEARSSTLQVYRVLFSVRARSEATQSVSLAPMVVTPLQTGFPTLPEGVRYVVDANGDGLPDLFVKVPTETFRYRVCINNGLNGSGFACDTNMTPDIRNPQFADLNGDGRQDLIYLPNQSGLATYRYRLATPSGLFTGPELQFGGNTIYGRLQVDGDTVDYFLDFDGDGFVEFVGINPLSTDDDFRMATTNASSRHRARDVIEEVINGYGARTSIRYLPMTNNEVYRPDRCAVDANDVPIASTCTRNKDWNAAAGLQLPGRGSPVLDALYAMYLVSHVESDAPTFLNPLARSLVSYQYAGAKLQAGGRGMLGFREIRSTDHNYQGAPAARVVTRTEYRQEFPFIGMPVLTEKYVAAGAASLSLCRSSERDREACRQTYVPGGFTLPPRSVISTATSDYGSIPSFAPGTQAPLFVHGSLSLEQRFNLPAGGAFGISNGALLSYTVSLDANFDGWGNPQQTGVDIHNVEPSFTVIEQFRAAPFAAPLNYEATVQRRKRTFNTYINDEASWRLGRLIASTVESTRRATPSDPLVTRSRVTSFEYDLTSSAKTGLMQRETVQPSALVDEELRTYYGLDAYGNRIATFQCSNDIAEALCRNPTDAGNPLRFRPADAGGPTRSVRRFTRTVFDAVGRYAIEVREPYFDPNVPTREWTEHASLRVFGRDVWGEPTHVEDANGVESRSSRGSLGRDYWSWHESGASSTTTYRWCVGVNGGNASCPSGAAFRAQSSANSGAISWSYHDRLGRAMAAASSTFNIGVAGQDVGIQCTGYDSHGRAFKSTEPRFLSGTLSGGTPSFTSQTNICTAAPFQTTTTFDVLSRAAIVQGPDGATTGSVFNGLETITTAPCNNVGGSQLCNRQFQRIENAAGEQIAATDANNFTVFVERDADGNPTAITRNAGLGAIGNSAVFDTRGRKTSQSDTDGGTWTYAYNAAGEMIERIDARGQRVRMDVDARGRVWRTTAESAPAASGEILFANGFEAGAVPSGGLIVDTVTFDTAANGLGLPAFAARTQAGATTITLTYAYDALARPASTITQLDGRNTTEHVIYDSIGREGKRLVSFVENYNNPNGTFAYLDGYENVYNARGYLQRVCRANDLSAIPSGCPSGIASHPVYYTVIRSDARGNVVEDRRHDTLALQTTRTFDPATGRVATITSGSGASIQQLTYAFDLAGNLVSRSDARQALTETFRYDALDRLIESRLNSIVNLSLTYDQLGNICGKNGQSYTYAGRAGCAGALGQSNKSAHAVTAAFGNTYLYDANGIQIGRDGAGTAQDRAVDYDAHHRLSFALSGSPLAPSDAREFFYAPDLSLARQIERNSSNQISRITHYIGMLEWTDRNPQGSANREARLSLPGGLVRITKFLDGKAPTVDHRYLFFDHLGSVDAIANETGAVIERMSFDAHGRRRSASNWTDNIAYGLDATTRRGYTGHEQLDGAGLIHMRARAYDPQLGRFLSPDPMVEPDATQGWNRYSYVLNNPLTATDPSGMISRRDAVQAVRTIVAIAITVYTGNVANGLILAGNAAGAASAIVIGGFTSGLVAGGLQGAVSGAFSSAAFFGIGSHFRALGTLNKAQRLQKLLAHGVAGGVMNTLGGGKFGHGFVSNAFTEAFAPAIAKLENAYAKGVISSLVGGTASVVSGGKFSSAALSSAFAWAFGQTLRNGLALRADATGGSVLCTPGDGMPPGPDPNELAFVKTVAGQFDELTLADTFEYAAGLYRSPSGDKYGISAPGTLESVAGSAEDNYEEPVGFKKIGSIHSHPVAGTYKLTEADIEVMQSSGETAAVGDDFTPNPMVFSDADIAGYKADNWNGWVVPAGTGKILYFPINQNGRCHYEYQFR